jgi:hypothetical protein
MGVPTAIAIGFVSKLCRFSADLSCGEDALSRLGTDSLLPPDY